jgi:DNA-binding HxlR family transcriptional regulator
VTRSYGQYCPLALAAELLAERWTLLVISRLIDGCTTFNAIQRGVPRISPSLLSKRLAELERAGVVEKRMRRGQVHPSYALTHAGEDLGPVIEWHTCSRARSFFSGACSYPDFGSAGASDWIGRHDA